MKLEDHIKHSIEQLGDSFLDLHQWLDAFALKYSQTFYSFETNPLDHRKHRHHMEGIAEAIKEFKGRYDEELIAKVCEMHIRDDYQGYLPCKKDFENPDFIRKYH